ncbi:alpha/beta fold hydrolase [Natrinema caseinilyticum]|uniref:alpha/beta fold hydrolase n=1 Tax=Natrinema caseinilyticum TaxID=2961570 RepID=UPI0020C33D4D|nr:alpha/beta fold hydrolase [Natrinema caseinilyticum]
MDRASWTDQAEALTGSDRFGLAIDPDDDRPTAIREAVAQLRTTVGVDHVVLVGASIGGEAAVVAAAEAGDDVDGLVAISPGGGTDRGSEIRARSLFVVAENDDERFVETTRRLHENAPDPSRLEVLSGDEHGQRLFETARGDDLEGWIDDVIETACREA